MSDVLGRQNDTEGADTIWSEFDGADEDDLDDRRPVRRHALWAMLVLFFAAAIAGSLMVLLGGGHHRQAILDVPSGSSPRIATPTSAASPTGSSASHAPAVVTARTSLPPSPGSHGNPCAGRSSCAVEGDGGAVAAVNAFRADRHLSPLRSVVVTSAAQRCARAHGSGATCVPHFAYTTLSWQDGAKAIDKVDSFNPGWLLDPHIQRIQIGWWYAGGSYNFAILKSP